MDNNKCVTYTTEFYPAIKKSKIGEFAGRMLEQKNIILRGVTQAL